MTAHSLASYDDLVHAIYAASLEPSRWPAVVERIALQFDGCASALLTPLHSPEQGGLIFSFNLAPGTIERWAREGRHADPFVQRASERGLLFEGSTVLGDELVPSHELVQTGFYRELWKPNGIGRVCSGVIFGANDTHQLPAVFSVYRRLSDPLFDTADKELLSRLLAHISRSLGVMFHLRSDSVRAAASAAALDRLACGVFLLEASGSILFANRAGQEMQAAGNPFAQGSAASTLQNLRLSSDGDAHAREKFAAMLNAALLERPADTGHFSDALVVSDAEGKPGYVIHVAPLRIGENDMLAVSPRQVKAIVVAYSLGTIASVKQGALEQVFGLTVAEARAAIGVLAGGSVKSMAARLGVSSNTLKSQLKAVYEKTGVNRQADLLKILLAFAGDST